MVRLCVCSLQPQLFAVRPTSALWLRWATRPFTRFHLALLVSVCVFVCVIDYSVFPLQVSPLIYCIHYRNRIACRDGQVLFQVNVKPNHTDASPTVKYRTRSVTLKLYPCTVLSHPLLYMCLCVLMCVCVCAECMHECVFSTSFTFTLTLGTCDSIVNSNQPYANTSPLRVCGLIRQCQRSMTHVVLLGWLTEKVREPQRDQRRY